MSSEAWAGRVHGEVETAVGDERRGLEQAQDRPPVDDGAHGAGARRRRTDRERRGPAVLGGLRERGGVTGDEGDLGRGGHGIGIRTRTPERCHDDAVAGTEHGAHGTDPDAGERALNSNSKGGR